MTMQTMERKNARSRTPILDSFKVMNTFVPEERHVERYICRDNSTIYINTAARTDAKVVKLIK